MIETEALYLLLAMMFVPLGAGIVWAFLTRQSKYDYKFVGGRLIPIRYPGDKRKEK